jgi:hypothetical protein
MNACRGFAPVRGFDEDRLSAGVNNEFSFADSRHQAIRFPTGPQVSFVHGRKME